MNAHIFHHTPFETAGSIQEWLALRGAHITETRFYEGESYPDIDTLDLLVVMGGTLSVNDEATSPWLVREKAFLRRAIARNVPTLGICLGSQMIASALGARVHANAYAEHGWFPVEGIAHGQECFCFPPTFTTFHSHGETFDLPEGAIQLARSVACEQQAFQYGANVVALQFHLESTPESAGAIVEGCADEFATGPYVQSQAELRRVPVTAYDESTRLMSDVLTYLTRAQV